MSRPKAASHLQAGHQVSPADIILRPFRDFARRQAASGIILIAAAVAALVWSNSPWASTYVGLWGETEITIGSGEHALAMPLIVWINDLGMALFFLLVGLEIKREILVGELASVRKAALPIIAAAGGMIVPGVIYAIVNLNEATLRGWGVPVATDIAFALGVLALLGKRAPLSLKVFLASLAIADDVGALLVIALFYTGNIQLWYLLGAGAALLLLVLINRLGFRSPLIFLLIGAVVWFLVHESGVHATIAGVLVAMTIPARASIVADRFLSQSHRSIELFEKEARQSDQLMTNAEVVGAVHAIMHSCRQVASPLRRIEHALHPWVAFLIVPLFAFANAGVPLGENFGPAIRSPVSVGVVLGLVVGKPVGIMLSSWVAVRLGIAALPRGVVWWHILGAALLAGIGFTMSLFIAHLAFEDAADLNAAKLGILVASLGAGILGWGVLRTAPAVAPPTSANPDSSSSSPAGRE